MRSSPQFAANPIGVFFDVARVYETFKSGTDWKPLQKAVYAGAFLPDPIPKIGLPA
jgi:catechol 2,3-dioxygenase